MWNKGQLVGQKPPLKPKDIWAIRFYLQQRHAVRDLAMFNLPIDSKLRGCDLVCGRALVGKAALGRGLASICASVFLIDG
ncbi:MAG TPA: recombinase XerD [Rhodocyclaceae bacterium]|nr:recombinase XerD [Rhodocyclaceae bacterium]